MTEIRTRFAPSPTGYLHIGGARTALFNWLLARGKGGKFILRIEDTDRARSRPEYEENIYKALKWAGICWDEGPDVGGPYAPYRQSERSKIYRQYAEKLLASGNCYECFCTPDELAEMRTLSAKLGGGRSGYSRRCRNLSSEEVSERRTAGLLSVIRLKVPSCGECVYEDGIKGRTATPWADVDDQILIKSDGFPTYHFANVVDDYLMKITHVIRGDEWMTSTPKHLLLYESFGWTPPLFLHMPLLLGKDGKKLSKRKNPTSIFFYRDSGYLPEAFLNFLSLMGYRMHEEKEIYSLDEMIKEFDPKRIGISGAYFDFQKLDWLNQHYLINHIPESQLWDRIKEWGFHDAFMKKLMPLCHTRIKTFGEFMELSQFFFINHLCYSEELLTPSKITRQQASYLLQAVIWCMDENAEWGKDGIEKAAHAISEVFGVHLKKVAIPLLYGALTGKSQGLPLFTSVEILGRDRVRARLLQAIEFLGGISNKKLDELSKAWKKRECSALGA
ncbi:MAG TPA: glutamate--tRNA ligase [Parachlamydiales bacterium]|nr:glutamate--tRNA ligase [Parachlamydiales bacterium]